MKRLLKKLMGIATEIAVMLLLVLVFFAILTTLLFSLFPSGISLTQILDQKSGSQSTQRTKSGWAALLDFGAAGAIAQAVATLSRTGNEVMSKGANSIAWSRAREGMQLGDHDAVQTFKNSSAQINFDSRNYLTMGSNSLVIIKRIEKGAVGNIRRSAVVVVDGELQGHVASGAQNPLELKFTTPAAGVKVLSGSSGANADFRISVNPDHSSTVVVFKGQAEVTAQGRTVLVGSNSGLTVKAGEAPGKPMALLAPPSAMTPADGTVIRYREFPGPVVLKWTDVQEADAYHLQVARDRDFQQLLIDEKLEGSSYRHGNLRQGGYFWRVGSIRNGIEGERGKGWRLGTLQDLTPPSLEVAFPKEPVESVVFLVAGTAEPGCRVFIRGAEVATDAAGAFSCELPAQPGRSQNLVTVEAVDEAGNVSYRSQYVERRF
jgi:hypothetical protein